MLNRRWTALAALLSTGLAASDGALAQSDWRQFRGPTGQGHAESAPLEWGPEHGVRWRADTPGRGWSSPVVADGVVWMTTSVETPDAWAQDATEIVTPAAIKGGAPDRVEMRLIGVDCESGQVVTDLPLFTVDNPAGIHTLNSYASPTGVARPGRFYASFGADGVVGVDTRDGRVRWRRQFEIDQSVGAGSSLDFYEKPDGRGVLLVVCDGMDQQFVVGLDPDTGDEVWNTPRPPIEAADGELRKSFCTPLIVENRGRTEAIIPSAWWICSYDPATGEEFWRYRHGEGFSVVPRPVVGDGVVYFSTGFSPPVTVALRLPEPSERLVALNDSAVVWTDKQQGATQASLLLSAGQLITVSDAGIAIARDADTGDLVWRTRIGSACSASPIATPDRLYFFNRDGETTLLPVGATASRPRPLAENSLEGTLMATPAVVDGRMYIRTTAGLYCVDGATDAASQGSAGS